MIVVGGRYIALECAQMFARFGIKVTILQRSERLLPDQDRDVSAEITRYLNEEGLDVITGTKLLKVKRSSEYEISYKQDEKVMSLTAEKLLLATGRTPNTDGLGLNDIGVEVTDSGAVKTNEHGQTSIPNIYAAGDVIDDHPFVYTAAYGGHLAVENAFKGNIRKRDFSVVPWVIFTDPQVAGVGLNEQSAKEAGIEVDVSKLRPCKKISLLFGAQI